ncbi:MAG TPA: DNA repair exonuclease [Pirellulales bacterium]
MVKFLHAADIHLDSPLRGLERYPGAPVEQIRQATRRALANLVDLALAEKVAFVLIAGDVYDGDWDDYHTGLHFAAEMARLREANIPVVLISGNHDAQSKMTRVLRLPTNVKRLSVDVPETIRFDDHDVAIHGQSFATQAVDVDLSAGYPIADRGRRNIGLLHTSADGRPGHEPYAPCSVSQLKKKGYDYWALGHIHKREVLAEGPWVAFPGNIQGRHIRETGPKGCLLVEIDDAGVCKIQPRWLDVLRWEVCRVDATDAPDAEAVLGLVDERLRETLAAAENRLVAVRMEIFGRTPAHAELTAEPLRWTNEVRSTAVQIGRERAWIEKVSLAVRPVYDADAAALSDGPLAELFSLLTELQKSDEKLSELGKELGDLKRRLPAELREGPRALALDSPGELRGLLDEVGQMLVKQLTTREGRA